MNWERSPEIHCVCVCVCVCACIPQNYKQFNSYIKTKILLPLFLRCKQGYMSPYFKRIHGKNFSEILFCATHREVLFPMLLAPSSKHLINNTIQKQKRRQEEVSLHCNGRPGHHSWGAASAAASGLHSQITGTREWRRRTGEMPCSASRMSTSSEIIRKRDHINFSQIRMAAGSEHHPSAVEA